MATPAEIQAQMRESIKLMNSLNTIHQNYADAANNKQEELNERLEIQSNRLFLSKSFGSGICSWSSILLIISVILSCLSFFLVLYSLESESVFPL